MWRRGNKMDDDERKDIRAGRAERWQDSMRDEQVPYYWVNGAWHRADGTDKALYSDADLENMHGDLGWTEVDAPEEDNG